MEYLEKKWYEYIVRWFDECASGEEKVTRGVTYAQDITEAMSQIGCYYGKYNIFTIKLHELNDYTCFDFDTYKEDAGPEALFESIVVQNKVQF